ncbi:MAG: hypothetical protein ACYDEQ_11245, partial [Desulfocucumaceae bacterium]
LTKRELDIGMNLAGFIALDGAVSALIRGARKGQTFSDVLKDIVNNKLSEDDKMLLMLFAHATWKACVPYRVKVDEKGGSLGPYSRILEHPDFINWMNLSIEEQEKDIVQVQAAAAKLLLEKLQAAEGIPYVKSATTGAIRSNDVSNQSGSPLVEGPGGIDFRALPIVTQAASNLSAGISSSALMRLSNVNLDAEWQQIERMSSSGIKPSPERIREYAQASSASGKISRDKDKIILCIADILRQEEEQNCETDPVLRDILVVLESVRQPQELKEVFLGKV